jgi:hypothetical protein
MPDGEANGVVATMRVKNARCDIAHLTGIAVSFQYPRASFFEMFRLNAGVRFVVSSSY